jgi:ADP-ribosylglycohydrolase
MIAAWESPLAQLKAEIVQREYEGYIVPEWIREQVGRLNDFAEQTNREQIGRLYEELNRLDRDPQFPFVQPNDLEAIRSQRPDGPRVLQSDFPEDQLREKLHGAWTGRFMGVAVGKPVEGLGMRGHGGMAGRAAIKSHLQALGEWPLSDYFSGRDAGDGIELPKVKSLRETISYMEPDDDVHYTLIGLKVLEDHGPDFSWHNVADTWNSALPYNAICTAEAQAILNYNMRTPRTKRRSSLAMWTTPNFTRMYANPYREWIGAQIRADGWAYCAAGNPELAAELAYRDACWTHTANGIYGEMFFAAIIAAAFVESDLGRLIEIGLSEIPANSKLAHAIRTALRWFDECDDWEAFMDRLDDEFAGMSPVHTVNNALIVLMALYYGETAPERSICTSVMGALDTDCNGATAGSVVGIINGRRGLPSHLADKLNDTVKPRVFGFEETTMSELAERTLEVVSRVREYARKRGAS